jgi:outer membrane protein assembly factor BamB
MTNKLIKATTFALAMCALSASVSWAQTTETKVEWNRFRGPNGSGVHSTSKAPLEWSNDKNVRWKCAIPGFGRSSPVAVKKQIFLTYHSPEPLGTQGVKKYLLCIDLKTGKTLWEKSINRINPEANEKHKRTMHSGYAPHTPATDGNAVYAYFGIDGLFAFDFDGKQLWHKRTGALKGEYGTGSSPIIHENVVVINAGVECGKLLAYDKVTGSPVWEAADSALSTSLSTPIIVSNDDENLLIIHMDGKVAGFKPLTGKLVWEFQDVQSPHVQIASPVLNAESIICASSYSNRVFALPFNGVGSSGGKELWSSRAKTLSASPLVANGNVFLTSNGVIQISDTENGKPNVKDRLGNRSPVLSSPIQIGDHWLVLASDGKSYVWPILNQEGSESLATPLVNQLNEEDPYFVATPAITDNEILIRSDHFLYCISADQATAATLQANNLGVRNAAEVEKLTAAESREKGKDFLNGQNGAKKDYSQAAKWLKSSSERGDAEAQYYYGALFIQGWGVKQNQAAGIDWFKKSASKGFWKAELQLKEWGLDWKQ